MDSELERKLRSRIDELWDDRDRLRREVKRLNTQVYRLEQRVELWRERAQRAATR